VISLIRVQTHSGTHWRKWTGMTACGSIVQGDDAKVEIDCPACLSLVSSWYPNASFEIVADVPLSSLDLKPMRFATYREAAAALTGVRRQSMRWRRMVGVVPKFTLAIS
jgi:hypothetical protein